MKQEESNCDQHQTVDCERCDGRVELKTFTNKCDLGLIQHYICNDVYDT